MRNFLIIPLTLALAACGGGSTTPDASESLAAFSDSLTARFNQYQAAGDPAGAVAWLDSLMRSTDPETRHDVEVVYAYALSRVDSLEAAERHMTHALSMPMESPDDRRLFRDYAYAAATFFPDVAHEEDVIAWGRLALEHAAACDYPPGTDYVRAMLADIYKRNGRVVDAINLLNDALAHSRLRADTTAVVSALNSLAQLYADWGLPAEADIYASEGAALTLGGGVRHPVIAAEALTVKAHCAVALAQPEAGEHLRRADSLAVGLPYNMGQEDIDLIYARHLGPAAAVERLNRYVANVEPYKAIDGWLELTKAYQLTGDPRSEALALDSLCHAIQQLSNRVRIPADIWNFAIGRCAVTGDRQHLEDLGRLLAADTLGTVDDYTRQYLWENVLQEQAAAHDMELKALDAEHRLRLTSLWLAIVGGMLALLVAVVVILWLRHRYRRRQALLSDQLRQAINDAEEERQRAENLIVQPESLGLIRQLTPSLLIEKGEMEFREQFIRIYPHFLTSLPELSHRDELLCMLIALEVDAHRCAQLLNITKASVNTARYRLRRKLALAPEQSLDDYVREHLG